MANNHVFPKEFMSTMIDKIRNFEIMKNKERDYYYRTPRNQLANRKNISIRKSYTYDLVRLMRVAFIYLNKNKYKLFTYREMNFWKIASRKKRVNTFDIQKQLQIHDWDTKREKYLRMCLTTMNKYDDKYGMFVACVVNRLFYNDLSRYILEYI